MRAMSDSSPYGGATGTATVGYNVIGTTTGTGATDGVQR